MKIASIPYTPISVSTTVEETPTDILLRVTWIQPLNGGANIDDYDVEFNVNGNWLEFESLCNGTASLVTTSCAFSMSLVQSTLDLDVEELIVA